MVRAIIDGRKTQTRRVGGWQKDDATELGVRYIGHATKGMVALATYRAFPKGGTARHALCQCPYGIPGDRLWVRETFHVTKGAQRWKDGTVLYRADHGIDIGGPYVDCATWKPSIFMPRCASRITLEIGSVRVERLQDITDLDARAEGSDQLGDNDGAYRKGFQILWDSINAKRGIGWEKNPWVWAIRFSKLQTPNTKPKNLWQENQSTKKVIQTFPR